jgi:iron complex transport system substrate-binding protein
VSLLEAPLFPERIVCLTEETTEILYRIGAGERVVGVSGYTVRPPEARKKPHVSSFLDANFDRILELKPDLVLGFSDLQAELARELIKRGVPVYVFNQRSVGEILQTVRVVSGLVGKHEKGERLVRELSANVEKHRKASESLPRRPRVFFEEWNEPLISGIRWCSELVELVGGQDVCAESRTQQGASGRVYAPEEVARRDPELVVASWCGRKVSAEKIRARPGWASVTAVREDQIYEIKSTYILQPGPAALTDGADQLARIVQAVARGERLPAPSAGAPRRAE